MLSSVIKTQDGTGEGTNRTVKQIRELRAPCICRKSVVEKGDIASVRNNNLVDGTEKISSLHRKKVWFLPQMIYSNKPHIWTKYKGENSKTIKWTLLWY